MNSSNINRRSFLRVGGATVGGLAIAGCADTDDSPSTDTEAETTTSSQTEESGSPQEQIESEQAPDLPEIGHLHGITGDTAPPDESGHYRRRYEWTAVGYRWWLELDIPRRFETYYEARHRQENRGAFVSDPYDDGVISTITDEFESLRDEYDLSDREVVDVAMAFVQQLQYTPDDVATGFTQHTYYPVQTLIDRGGDCEDTAVLLAAILRDLGYGSVLLAMWDAEHMALGVKGDHSIPGTYYEYNGERYYYVETTGDGWRVGELPPSIENTRAEIQEIHQHPTLVYRWESSTNQTGEVTVRTDIRNVGQETARNVSFHSEFENRSERVVASTETQIGSLSQSETSTETVELRPSENETLRLNTAVLVTNNIHDLDRSEWRRPV